MHRTSQQSGVEYDPNAKLKRTKPSSGSADALSGYQASTLKQNQPMKHNRYYSLLGLIACAFLFLVASICRADVTFDVSIDTSALMGHPAGPFYIDFQLNDGSGDYSSGVNTATISNFIFDGGDPTGTPQLLGGATGSLTNPNGVTLTDNAHFINEFFQPFTPGRSLKFTVSMTTNVDPGLTPDAFSFSILDNRLSPVPTTNFADAFLFVNINSATITAADLRNSIFASNPTQPPLAGGDGIAISKPDVRETRNPPPTITGGAVDKPVLWPPNHQLVNITVNYEVTDDQPLPPNSCTLDVTSNEAINGTGAGDTSPDWIILDAHHVQLRAERAGNGNGRIYTVGITCTDSGGNSSSKSVTVSVPHDRGRK